MRIVVFFDLPTLTKRDRIQYRRFRRYLINYGYVMVQESVYSKLALNNASAEVILKGLRANKPKNGNVQILKVSERQYQNIEFLVGESQKEVIDSMERLVVL